MKTLLLCTLSALLATSAVAQNARIHHRITTAKHDAPQLGRDCYFTLLDIDADAGGKYFALYLTSPDTTTAYIHLTGGSVTKIKLQPYQSSIFNIPLSWGMTSSGKIENKGIHVWSENADLSCYVMSHNALTSDGMYVLPTIGWGKEYVVAGYAALFEGFGSNVFDLPSEFAIVANHDSTHVNITAPADLRMESSTGACCSCVAAQRGQTFQIVLMAGQSIQYKTTCTQDCDNFDLTGTVITSDKIIGVVAGSMGPNIPCDFPYADHVCEMIPPTRTWGNIYYSLPFYQKPGTPPSHTASTFLVIATKQGQVIERYDNDRQQRQVYFTASKKFDYYWRNDIDQGSAWTSDTAFLVVQYINSNTYPDQMQGQGNPAEVVLQPVEGYTKTVLFQIPDSLGNVNAYTSYVNIIARPKDRHVTLDGQSVLGLHTVYIDGIYSGYRAANVQHGAHEVKSDSGVSVYIYGYGNNESYAGPGLLGTATFNSTDTTAPRADTSGSCYSAHVALSDYDGDSGSVGISDIRLDSIHNAGFTVDPTWIQGGTRTKSYYDMQVADISKPAILIVSVFDQAGNHTTVTSTYTPQSAHIGPDLQDFGVGTPSNCTYMYDTLVNTGKASFAFTELALVLGNQGFSIDSAVRTPLAVGETRLIKLCFKPIKGTTTYDTILFGNPCVTQSVTLMGNGGAPDFRLTGHDWGMQLRGRDSTWNGAHGPAIVVVNTSPTQPIQIDSMWVDDPVHFVPTQNTHWATRGHAIILAPKGHDTITFTFHSTAADTLGTYRTTLHAQSNQLVGPGENGIRSNILMAYLVTVGEDF